MAGSDTEEEVGLAEEGQTEGFVIDVGGEFVTPGKNVGHPETGACRLGLEKGNFFGQGGGSFFVIFRPEILKELGGLAIAKKETGKDTIFDGQAFSGAAAAIEAIDQSSREPAARAARLFVFPEKGFPPGREGGP